jgi:hypothetical protein
MGDVVERDADLALEILELAPPDGGLFGDQRPDEARSACFESPPLPEPVAILGAPRVRLRISHPGPRAIVSVKLNDVSPGGESQPVTRGAVNVACAGGADVEVDLMATGWRFRPGHRIRVAVAEGDTVPVIWPEARTSARPSRWEVVDDRVGGPAGIDAEDWSAFELPGEGIACEEGHVYSTRVDAAEPLSARVEGRTRFGLRRPGLDVVSEASGRFTCTEDEFVVELRLAVTRDGQPFARREWHERIAGRGT